MPGIDGPLALRLHLRLARDEERTSPPSSRPRPLPCMLYNNPVAYKTDFLPAEIAELAAEYKNLNAVKESSADVFAASPPSAKS